MKTVKIEIPATKLEWSETLLDGRSVNYEQAEKAVAELGDGWRLPTVKELFSIIDHSKEGPAIDTEEFHETKSSRYWTSTPCTWNDAARWVVGFYNGLVLDSPRLGIACVRAVRASQ